VGPPPSNRERSAEEGTLSPPTKPQTPAPYHMVPWRVDRGKTEGPRLPGASALQHELHNELHQPTRLAHNCPRTSHVLNFLPSSIQAGRLCGLSGAPPSLNGSAAVRAVPPQRRPLGASLPVEKPTPRSSWIWGESASCGIREGILAGVTLGVIRGVSCSRGN
jgi:hypothetical protein